MTSFQEAIETARRTAPSPRLALDTSTTSEGAEVQLSVRVPEGLRSAVAATAAAQGMTLTAFVERALRTAVMEANDSFSALSADLTRTVRAEIRALIEDGTYGEVSAALEQVEAWP